MGYFREIFGPLLPVVPVENVDEAIKFVNERYDFPSCFIVLLC
jgi:acyl-CoA reductase-like NAD-dependent aldehyde dehydrogenase